MPTELMVKILKIVTPPFNRAMIILGVVAIHQQSFLSLHDVFNRVREILDIADFFISQESPLAFAWMPVLELETHPSSLSLVPGQKPQHCTFQLHPAGRLSPPSQSSSQVYFHFVQMVSNHICRTL